MSCLPCLFHVHMDAMMKQLKMGKGRLGGRLMKEERDWRLLFLFCAPDLVFCGESEEDLIAMVRCFVDVCRRKRSERVS